jgi:hypothetical protein
MVLTSIIIGLGITYILIGVGSAIERITGHGAPLRLSWAHATWLLTLFVWMVSFWWWEFRLLAILKSWTLAHYFFIITYAVLLFLLAVLLLPRDWATTESLDDYFLSKRQWFYPLYLIATFADIVDAWLKGGWPGQWCRSLRILGRGATSVPGWCSVPKYAYPHLYGGLRLRFAVDCSVRGISETWLLAVRRPNHAMERTSDRCTLHF